MTITLTESQLEQIGRELDAIRAEVLADLGERDRDYILRIIRAQRALEVAGRGSLYLGFLPPFWLAGTAALGLSKILDNMEIGHNVMHGQYDWMREPGLNAKGFEWDTACPAEQWRHSHNYLHHTFTNILDMDRDIGYGVLRMDPAQPWHPYYLGNPLWAALLMTFFQYGVALHDLEFDPTQGLRTLRLDEARRGLARAMWAKVGRQALKDYLLFPALTGPLFVSTLAADATANLIRNVWAFSIIFCGHFPSGVQVFTPQECEQESRGHWYVRQLLGSANITGGALFHVLSGNLSHQIEHHLFPDLPAHRYAQIAPKVQALCAQYGLPYNSGPLRRQLGSTWGKILRLALPTRRTAAAPAVRVVPDPVPAAA